MTYTPTQDEREAAYGYIRGKWHDAHSMRFEGKCHQCKRQSMWSFADKFTKERTNRDGEVEETCGYVCVKCRWSNAGSRPVVDPELDMDGDE